MAEPTKRDPAYVDVFDILPDISIDFSNWWQSERDVITPALVAAGYEVGGWYTAEGDSFGPLIRAMRATAPDGKETTIVYG